MIYISGPHSVHMSHFEISAWLCLDSSKGKDEICSDLASAWSKKPILRLCRSLFRSCLTSQPLVSEILSPPFLPLPSPPPPLHLHFYLNTITHIYLTIKTGAEWMWSKDSKPTSGVGRLLTTIEFKAQVVVRSITAFVLMSTVTAMTVRTLLSSGVVIMFPMVMILERIGLQGVDVHVRRFSNDCVFFLGGGGGAGMRRRINGMYMSSLDRMWSTRFEETHAFKRSGNLVSALLVVQVGPLSRGWGGCFERLVHVFCPALEARKRIGAVLRAFRRIVISS